MSVWRIVCVWIWKVCPWFLPLFPSLTWYKNSLVTDLCTRHFETMSTFLQVPQWPQSVRCMSFIEFESQLVSILVRECLRVSTVDLLGQGILTEGKGCSIEVYSFYLDLTKQGNWSYISMVVQSRSCTVIQFLFFNKSLFWTWIHQFLFSISEINLGLKSLGNKCQTGYFWVYKEKTQSEFDSNNILLTSVIYWPIKWSTEKSRKDNS